MEEYHQITLNEWVEMKTQLRRELNNVRTGFVRVGYVLRKMEETEAYKAEGYKSVAEFAEREHGLKPSTTSRWMSINREYSIDGYSMQLDPKWIDMNASQLTEMLALSAEDRELVSPGTPREDIRELKRLEKMPEERSDFENIVRSFFESNPEDLANLRKMQSEPERYSETAWIELLAPSGNRAYRKNGAMIFLYEDKIKFKRSGHSPEIVQWSEFWRVTEGIGIPDEKGEENVGRYDSGRGDAGDDGGTEGNAPGKAGSDSAGAHEDGGYIPAGRNETHADGEGSGSESTDDKGGKCESEETEMHEAGDSGSFGEDSAEEKLSDSPADTADQAEEEESGDVIEGINPPVGNVENVDNSAIAPAQFAQDSGGKSTDSDASEEPEIIIDEAGNPSPEEPDPEERDPEEEKIEAARDNADLIYTELGKAIRDKRWFKARELAAQLHEDLEYLAKNDMGPAYLKHKTN